MNVTEEQAAEWGYPKTVGTMEKYFAKIFGATEALYVYNTYQFPDYANYVSTAWDETAKAKQRGFSHKHRLDSSSSVAKGFPNGYFFSPAFEQHLHGVGRSPEDRRFRRHLAALARIKELDALVANHFQPVHVNADQHLDRFAVAAENRIVGTGREIDVPEEAVQQGLQVR